MSRLQDLQCIEFREHEKGDLRGYADFALPLDDGILTILECALFTDKNGHHNMSLPHKKLGRPGQRAVWVPTAGIVGENADGITRLMIVRALAQRAKQRKEQTDQEGRR